MKNLYKIVACILVLSASYTQASVDHDEWNEIYALTIRIENNIMYAQSACTRSSPVRTQEQLCREQFTPVKQFVVDALAGCEYFRSTSDEYRQCKLHNYTAILRTMQEGVPIYSAKIWIPPKEEKSAVEKKPSTEVRNPKKEKRFKEKYPQKDDGVEKLPTVRL